MDRDQTIENNQNVVVCVVCGDPAEEIPPCSHGYCWDCLTQLILHGCRDGERWPPRCCIWEVNMASPEIRENLPEDVLQLAALSKAYYSATGKLFCCNSKCRKYIPPGEVDEFTHIGFCRACWGGTCALCRRYPHIGTCRKDFQQKSMEKYLIYMGWKRCEQCGRIVERAAGCNHIVCTCGEEFCYICGEHWRHCYCPQFGSYILEHEMGDAANAWFQIPQVPRCYGKEFLVNTCLPQTFFCAKCGHRCGRSGGSSYQCQDCGRHLCRSCVIQCVDDGRYHNPDWNAEPAEGAEFFAIEGDTEAPSTRTPMALAQLGNN
ncbi:hypothetical protein FJTKL_08625 [Diaporthe vaccinii]|uniref:RBR-type E3 ubiquitin transferase n=1 Tax=Diaporthe vaccinii TaxID=105482 RepID=A0ABR4ER77_9PEZI